MKTSELYFDLPEELIAQEPVSRGESRLLVADPADGSVNHTTFSSLPDYLDPDTLLIMNNSRVFPARITGTSETGGTVHFLLIEKISGPEWIVLSNRSKRLKPGKRYTFPEGLSAEAGEKRGGGTLLRFDRDLSWELIEAIGKVPLPPYIKREPSSKDLTDYQTVYAREKGSIAAPTAGLHFTEKILSKIQQARIDTAYVTLHVGIGTFTPIRTETVEEHRMHRETYSVPEETAEKINSARAEGRKITAVGTTAVRTLESWAGIGKYEPGTFSSQLFIYPGYSFSLVDAMVTNFHTPGSTLLAMVYAFGGTGLIKRAYDEAVERKYRFFSYGDAMFIRNVSQ